MQVVFISMVLIIEKIILNAMMHYVDKRVETT